MTRLLPLAAAVWLAAVPVADRRGPEPRRIVAGALRSVPIPDPRAATLPRFALFGWCSPPRAFTTPARYAELAGAGLNVTVLAVDDSMRLEDNRARLDATRALGVRNLIVDRRLRRFVTADPSTHAVVDTVVADYAADPALLGWYLGDEPSDTSFTFLGALFERFRQADAVHPCWNNLYGRVAFGSRDAWLDYTRGYVQAVKPVVLCNDHYDFRRTGDLGLFVENVAGLASVARENALPFWGVILLVEHRDLRRPNAGLLRWQAAQWLSYGARGIGYFTYWTPAPDPAWNWQPAVIDHDGTRTAMYDTLRALNVPLRAVGEALAGCQWFATWQTGDVPLGGTPFQAAPPLRRVRGRASIGLFADSTGGPVVFVANRDSVEPATITLTFGGARTARFIADDGAWRPLAMDVSADSTMTTLILAPGGYTLLSLSGSWDDVVTGRGGPRLAISPNPANAGVRFEASELSMAARIEVIDLAGRRVWSRTLPPGAIGVTWSGERSEGGRAPAGVYFARVEDARGVAVRRLSWLGGR